MRHLLYERSNEMAGDHSDDHSKSLSFSMCGGLFGDLKTPHELNQFCGDFSVFQKFILKIATFSVLLIPGAGWAKLF